MKSVLLVGEDLELLNIRAVLLKRLGVQVASASSLDRIPSGEFDLLVLCHTLTPEVQKRWVDRLKRTSPVTQVLQIDSAFGDHVSLEHHPVTTPDPQSLLDQVTTLLAL